LGIDPPKWHDVGQILQENADALPPAVEADLSRVVKLSAYLRKERELAFCGDEDFLPSRNYSDADSSRGSLRPSNSVRRFISR
jgi:hypothetical protein